MNKTILTRLYVLTVFSFCGLAYGEVYDSFNGKDTWKFPRGFSPNGKWVYEYGNNPDWAPLAERDGSLWFYSVHNPGHSVTSTETWDLPAQPGESLTFTLAVTNFFFNKESTFREHWIEIVGDAATLGVFAGWSNPNWNLWDQGSTDTKVPSPPTASGTRSPSPSTERKRTPRRGGCGSRKTRRSCSTRSGRWAGIF